MERGEKFGLLARLRAQEKILGTEAVEAQRLSYHFKEKAAAIRRRMKPISDAREALERELTPVQIIKPAASASSASAKKAALTRAMNTVSADLSPESAAKLKAALK